jgi:2-keto-4-pentenoate hydratase/2-oxohepta-3-ene-1,7-dioic acid hydratase in catechol pathway
MIRMGPDPSRRFPAILAIGRNYSDHAREMGHVEARPAHPMVFMKNPASACRGGDPIRIPAACREHGPEVDWEGELAVEIARDCRDVPRERAFEVIAGYRVANDVSARWWQKEGSGGQFCRGKSFDTFCPLSDLAPAAAVGDPRDLRIETRLNGEVVQGARTSLMLFPVDELVAELSRGMTLLAGTLILTGTPAGVGAGRTPPRFLDTGDEVEVTIERVGSIRNRVE